MVTNDLASTGHVLSSAAVREFVGGISSLTPATMAELANAEEAPEVVSELGDLNSVEANIFAPGSDAFQSDPEAGWSAMLRAGSADLILDSDVIEEPFGARGATTVFDVYDTAKDAAQIDDFDPARDTLELHCDDPENAAVQVRFDAVDCATQIFLNEEVVARFPGVVALSAEDVVLLQMV